MTIDVHAHYWTDDYLDRVRALGKTDTDTQRGLGAGGGAELDARLRLMDRAGVDLQILSPTPQMPYARDEKAAAELARWVNDQYAQVVHDHPDRFRAFVSTPMPHIDASIDEIGRGLDDLGFAGVAFTTTVLGVPLTDSAFEPVFDELERRAAVVYIHPAGESAQSPLIADHQTWQSGAPMEDCVNLLSMIEKGYPSRYPHIRFVISHLGGAMPMLLQRWDNQIGWEAPGTPEKPSVAVRRLWFDSVGHGWVPALRAAAASVGADRLVLGTDFPYEDGDVFVRAIDYVGEALEPEEADAVLTANATRLFGDLVR